MSNLTPELLADEIREMRPSELLTQRLVDRIALIASEARNEGAQVERAECVKIFNDYESLSAKAWDERYGCESVVEVIQARGNQAGEGKVGE
jgi:putative aminopeptidase FrvX